MANCALCGVSMTVNERNVAKNGAPLALHNDCANREEHLRLAQAGNWPKSDQTNIQNEINQLAARRSNSALHP